MREMKFTVLATSYNDTEIILDYLKSVTNQTLLPNEYILVDGGSTDDTVQLAESFQSETGLPIRVISGQRLNIAEGYNAAIKASNTDVVVITGVGNQYSSDFFEELIIAYSQKKAQIVYGPLMGQDNNFFSSVYNRAHFCGNRGRETLVASNHGVLIEKAVFQQIGYFYEGFIYAGEDSEFFKRARLAGISSSYAPKAKLYWDTPRSIKEYLKQKDDYFIGEIQHNGYNKKAALNSLLLWCCVILGVAFCWTPWPYVGAGLFYVLKGYKIKSFYPLAVFLNAFNMLLFLWVSVKNKKYIDEKYRVDLSELSISKTKNRG